MMCRIHNRLAQAIPVNVVNAKGDEETFIIPAKGYIDKPKELVEKSLNVKAMASPKRKLIVLEDLK
jgi:hypothetical protein